MLSQLAKDIYAYLRSEVPPTEAALQELGTSVALAVGNALGPRRDPTKLSLSKIGKPCGRQLWYQLKGYPGEELQGHTLMKFLYGHLVETLVLWLAKEAGHTVERQQECVEVDGVRGAIDAVVDGYLVDVKSMSSYSFNSLEKYGLANDPFGYSGQLAGYKQGLGTSVKDGMYILGVDKQNGHVAAVRVTTDLDAEERIAEIREDSQSDEPPPRPYTDKPEGASGNRMLGIECSYCAFKRTCWPGLRTFLYSNGPKFLTHVEMPPRVQEVSSEV